MKKGQITIFIIVGIVILLAIGLGVAAWKIINSEKPPQDQNKKETNVELKPINDFIDNCLHDTARNVFENIGLHGGYYNPESFGYVQIPGRPTESRALEAFPGQTIPYWSYMSSTNDCTSCSIRSEEPTLEGTRYPAIQWQATQAIQNAFPQCINDFAGWENRYVITPKGDPVISVNFGATDIQVSLKYPLDVQTESQSITTLNDFSTSLDIPLRQLYNYSDQIRRAQEENQFFEGMTLELINVLSVNNNIPPPFGSTEVTYDPGPFWSLQDVKQKVAAKLEQYVSIVQLLGSTDMVFVHTGNRTIDGQYSNYDLMIADPAPAAKATFTYLSNWEPYVAVHPGGALIRPDTLSVGVPFIPPLKRMDFQYDVSYPVLVQLRAPSKDGEYLFQTAMEVNVRDNNPVSYTPIDTPDPGLSFCDPANEVGTVANISVVGTDGLPLDADISYRCVSASCDYGTARNGKLVQQLPLCINGVVASQRDGFKTATASLDSVEGNESITLTMQRFTTVNVTPAGYFIRRQVIPDGLNFKRTWQLSTDPFQIYTPDVVNPPYNIIIIFTPRDDPTNTQVISLPGDKTTVDLYPGDYDISGVVMQNLATPKVVTGGHICYDDTPLNPFDSNKCQDIPNITFGQSTVQDENGTSYPQASAMYIGGLNWGADTKNITLTQDQLDSWSASGMTIPLAVVYLPHITTVVNEDGTSDLDAFNLIDSYSEQLTLQ